MSEIEECGHIGYQTGRCVLAKGHAGYHTGPLKVWPNFESPPGEMRPFHNRWLLKAVLREALRNLETEDREYPTNIVVIGLVRTLQNFQRGVVDS